MEDDEAVGNIFSVSALSALKQKERVLMERRKSGYYRDKYIHKSAYKKSAKHTIPI